jgi:ABC-type transport system substrate-binding protein
MLEITSFKGVLDNLNVRRALSMALNRQGIIDPVYHGAAQLPRWISNPADPDQRAALVARAEELTMQQLPFIPDVEPDTVLVLGKGLTGALSFTAYLFSPWGDQAGGTG